jgi:transposase-like protein
MNPRHVVLAAVGIESNGTKHVLGLREGATENAAACKALLADLIERGLDPNRAILVVIDGAKALHKAVSKTFGARVLIHRCHAHKKFSALYLRAAVCRFMKPARHPLEPWTRALSRRKGTIFCEDDRQKTLL